MSDKEGRIRQRAYEIWQRGGQREGSHLEHWFQASREINAEEETGSGAVVERTVQETASSAGPEDASSPYEPDAGLGTEPVPKTAGANVPGPDTSRSRVANRDPKGPRKASTTPRPTDKPIVGS